MKYRSSQSTALLFSIHLYPCPVASRSTEPGPIVSDLHKSRPCALVVSRLPRTVLVYHVINCRIQKGTSAENEIRFLSQISSILIGFSSFLFKKINKRCDFSFWQNTFCPSLCETRLTIVSKPRFCGVQGNGRSFLKRNQRVFQRFNVLMIFPYPVCR